MRLLDQVKFTKLFFQLVQDPGRTELIFKAIDIVSKDRHEPLVVKLLEEIYEKPGLNDLYQEKYVGTLPTLEALSKYPVGSFGYVYYKHMSENNLAAELFPRFDPQDRLDYVNLRMYQEHDLWHALLGYGISVEDELAVQAFSAAQLQTPFSVMLIAGGLLHLLKSEPIRAVTAIREVAEGFERGQKSQFLLGFRLDEHLAKPIEDVRRICGIAS